MKKTYAILASIAFAIEILIIAFSLPQYTNIIISGIYISLLFYFVIKSEKVIDEETSYRRVIHYTEPKERQIKTRKKRKVTTKKSQPSPKPTKKIIKKLPLKQKLHEPKKPSKKEEEDDEFMKQWHKMEKAAE